MHTCHMFTDLIISMTGYMARYNASPARTAVGEYVEIALKYGMTPTQLALAWCHQRSCVTSTIIGATSTKQLKVTVAASQLSDSLTDWMSDTRSQGYTDLQSRVKCLDHRVIVSDTACSQAKVVLGCLCS